MRTRDALKTMTAADIAHVVETRQGANALRNLLGVGGLYGVAVNAQSERCSAAALQGLRDGWFGLDSQAEYYADGSEELAWYETGLEVASAALCVEERAA